MKKLALLIFILTLSIANYSQLTLLKEIEGDYMFRPMGELGFIESPGWYAVDKNRITVYDDDLNAIKAFNIPVGIEGVSNLCKNIFTLSDKYEYTAKKIVDNVSYYYLYNEDGNMVYDFGEFSPYAFKGNKLTAHKTKNVDGKIRWICRIYKIAGTVNVIENPYGQVQQQPYPNPARETINVPYSIDSAKGLEIYNAGGSLVDIIMLDPQNTVIQVATLNYKQGIYFWRIGDTHGSFIVR